jgi:hypothetical protein
MTGYGERPLGQAGAAVAYPSPDEAIYDCHAARLYQQALLTLGDAGLAEQVVSDVITAECLRPAAQDPDGAERRLGVSVRRRCHELTTGPAWWNRLCDPLEDMPGGIAPRGLSVRERAAIALVVFGHLGYVEAAREMAISPADMATLLLAVLHKLTAADLPV